MSNVPHNANSVEYGRALTPWDVAVHLHDSQFRLRVFFLPLASGLIAPDGARYVPARQIPFTFSC
eukprot:1260186-Rhodomonas_salina.2